MGGTESAIPLTLLVGEKAVTTHWKKCLALTQLLDGAPDPRSTPRLLTAAHSRTGKTEKHKFMLVN